MIMIYGGRRGDGEKERKKEYEQYAKARWKEKKTRYTKSSLIARIATLSKTNLYRTQ